jgi:aminoglycoside phosphotransferase (APT) family kinase protein
MTALAPETVAGYLRGRGLDVPDDAPVADLSGGGVSSVVLAVDAAGGLVVKQSRPALAVAELWTAPRERTITEGRALALAERIAPGWSPPLVDLDEERMTLTMRRAPGAWPTWKQLLLEGDARPGVAASLGRRLAGWHAATTAHPGALAAFDQREAFEALRVDPYYRVAGARNPAVAERVAAVRERMLGTGSALVHGDFSPKNVLVGPDRAWLIDFEVTHVGDPTFDLGFLLNHLALKAIHVPQAAAAFRGAAAAFLTAYADGAREDLAAAASSRHLFEQVGCLMLARVDGKSPAEYLDEAERHRARGIAIGLLREPVADVTGLWARLADADQAAAG